MTGVPIVLCDQAPRDSGPVLIAPGSPCPFCGGSIADHQCADTKTMEATETEVEG
jgi:hypothetical protein